MTMNKLSRLFYFLILVLMTGMLIYEHKMLMRMQEAIEGLNTRLKRSLVMSGEEFSIKKVLDKKGTNRLTELEKIRISRRISGLEDVGVDSAFTLDLIRRESSFDPKAVSSKGAIGLMQLKPSTAKWLSEKGGVPWKGDEILFDPVKNVELGTAYLAYLSQDFGDEGLLRAAYQSGPNRVKANMKGGLYARDP